uniref:Uncharacterized protein n=1 Tax=Tanacetum cinerariifolium TaxID=118510 RepID=A0A699J8X8_TANCI|nr:hypothetical protein [Tanacetum cinerariifolium]
MATTLDQQVALDEALVLNVPEIYMQEFWATGKLHQHSIRFKMDTRKHVLDLEAFREMLHISPLIPGQSFADLPFEEEILEFLSLPSPDETELIGITSGMMYCSLQSRWYRDTRLLYNTVRYYPFTTEDIRNNKAYKEYYACATGEAAPKPKASARKKTSGSASSTTPPTPMANSTPTTTVVAAPRLSAAAKGVPDVPSDDSEEELSWNSSDDEDMDEQTKGREESERDKTDVSDDDNDHDDDEEETTKIGEQEVKESDEGDDEATESDRESEDEKTREQEEESFDLIPRTPKDNEDDDDNNEEDQGLRIGDEERMQEEEDAEELYREVDINQGRGLQVSQETEDSHVILTLTQSDAQQESSSTSSFMTNLLNPIIDPEAMQTQTNQLQDSIQRENDEFLKTIDENMKKIIKEQVKTQVKVQVTRILPIIEEAVNAQLEAEVLTRSSHSSRTSYAMAADLSEMELKKILIEKMEGNKSIQRSDEQRNLYKALVKEGPSAGSDRGSKRRREGGEHTSASTPSKPATRSASRSTTGSQSRQLSASESAFAKEPVQTTCQMEAPSYPVFETGVDDQPIIQTTQHPEWFSQPRRPPTPDRDWNKSVPVAQGKAQSWINALAKQTNARSSFNELLDTLIDFSNFIMNRLGVDTFTPKLLAGPTYELMRGSCNSLMELEYHLEEVYKATTDQLDWVNPEGQQYPHNLLQPLPLIPDNRGRSVIPFEHFINNDLEYLRGAASSRKYTTSVTKTKAADYGHIKWIEDLVPRAMWIQEPISYDKHAL